jgi:6-pyruvoyl-tetrahydropterin synthase
MSKQIFISMREEEYNEIPNELKERYLNSKNVTKETNDWSENMKDELFNNLYVELKKMKKKLDEREFQLREERRKKL